MASTATDAEKTTKSKEALYETVKKHIPFSAYMEIMDKVETLTNKYGRIKHEAMSTLTKKRFPSMEALKEAESSIESPIDDQLQKEIDTFIHQKFGKDALQAFHDLNSLKNDDEVDIEIDIKEAGDSVSPFESEKKEAFELMNALYGPDNAKLFVEKLASFHSSIQETTSRIIEDYETDGSPYFQIVLTSFKNPSTTEDETTAFLPWFLESTTSTSAFTTASASQKGPKPPL